MGFNLKRISLEIKPRTNRNGSLNAPRSRSGHRDPSITRGSPSISALSGFNLRGSPPPLPVGASNQRGSPSNLGSAGPRTVEAAAEKQPNDLVRREKQRILGPQGSPLAQNASIASPKPIERLSYLEFSQKHGQTPLRRLEQRRHGQLCVEPHVPPALSFHAGYTLPPSS
jgi:hypothetical protein